MVTRACVCLRVCLSVRGRMPTLLHRPGCNLGEWYIGDAHYSCPLLGGFAIGARVALLYGKITRRLNVSEYMLVLAVCLVTFVVHRTCHRSVYTPSPEEMKLIYFCLYLCQMLANFQFFFHQQTPIHTERVYVRLHPSIYTSVDARRRALTDVETRADGRRRT